METPSEKEARGRSVSSSYEALNEKFADGNAPRISSVYLLAIKWKVKGKAIVWASVCPLNKRKRGGAGDGPQFRILLRELGPATPISALCRLEVRE